MNILVTGAGSPGGPGIIKELKRKSSHNVIAADINPLATGRFLVDTFVLIKAANSENFISTLLEKSLQNNIDIIIPLVTAELEILSKNRQMFSNYGIKILVSDLNDLIIANDKGKILKLLKKNNVRTVQYEIVNSVAGLEQAAKNLGYPTSLVIMKPCNSNGSRGIRILDHGFSKFEQLFNEKPGSLTSSLRDVVDAIGDGSMPEMVVTEFLPGDEVTVDTIVTDGRVLLLLARLRSQMRAGISTAGSFISNNDISNLVGDIIGLLPGLDGPIGLQFKKSQTGEFQLLEINPRLQGTSVAARGLGINFPSEVVSHFITGEISDTKTKDGISFSRYYDEIFF